MDYIGILPINGLGPKALGRSMRGIKKESASSSPTILFSDLQKPYSGTEHIWVDHLLLVFYLLLFLNVLQAFF